MNMTNNITHHALRLLVCLLFCFSPFLAKGQSANTFELLSPNENISVKLELKESRPLEGDTETDPGCLYYQVSYRGKGVLGESQLGLIPAAAPTLFSNFEVMHTTRAEQNSMWKPVYGERAEVPENYRELTLHLKETIPPYRYLDVTFRAYNGGIAFRYQFPQQEPLKSFALSNEFTQFKLPEGTEAWASYRGMQKEYTKTPLKDLGDNLSLPLTLELPNGMFASIMEAHMDDYSRMQLSNFSWREENTLIGRLSHFVHGSAPFSTSWKLVLIGEEIGDLMEHNYLVENLNPPNRLTDTDWIKPGKMMREMTLSTVGAKAYIDFASEHGLQYILFDGGWYGSPIIDQTDAKEALPWKHKIKSTENEGRLDMEEVIAYGNEKGVGVFLYLDRRVVERRMDYLLPHYQKMGVKGLKLGFVHVKSQEWTRWLHELIAKCAQFNLLVDVHDEYYPTGLSRTYPNLLTQEGILGNEAMPSADHNVTLPFTRMLAGAADYTPAYYSRKKFGSRKEIQPTPAHQLALPVVIYSPLQSLFWYDHPDDYQGEPEIEFWKHVPTTWDETKVIDAQMGEYVVIARRKGEEWFVGGITNGKARTVELDFDFLSDSKPRDAKLYADDETVETRTQVAINTIKVRKGKPIKIDLKPSGGFAMWIR